MIILISDTHFGCRQNSITWLDSQMKFFYDQLIPFIRQQKEKVHIYHLGDVFDSRSSISLLVANRVKKLFKDLYKVASEIVIIGGNHDYYSPIENEDNINSLRLILGDLEDNHGFFIADKDFRALPERGELFIPWFRYYDFDKIKEFVESGDYNRIYIHNDLTVTLEDKYRDLFSNCSVYSGHIHTPKHANNLHTLGATFALTFADANSNRGFYTMSDDGSNFQFHPNVCSIRFWRWNNGDIFGNHPADRNDYVELYINQDNMTKDSYVQRMRELSKQFTNITIIPITTYRFEDNSTDFEQYDIQGICSQNIPESLKEKFNKISSDEYSNT